MIPTDAELVTALSTNRHLMHHVMLANLYNALGHASVDCIEHALMHPSTDKRTCVTFDDLQHFRRSVRNAWPTQSLIPYLQRLGYVVDYWHDDRTITLAFRVPPEPPQRPFRTNVTRHYPTHAAVARIRGALIMAVCLARRARRARAVLSSLAPGGSEYMRARDNFLCIAAKRKKV